MCIFDFLHHDERRQYMFDTFCFLAIQDMRKNDCGEEVHITGEKMMVIRKIAFSFLFLLYVIIFNVDN